MVNLFFYVFFMTHTKVIIFSEKIKFFHDSLHGYAYFHVFQHFSCGFRFFNYFCAPEQ